MPSYVIFGIRELWVWRSGLSVRVPGCHMATVGVKGLMLYEAFHYTGDDFEWPLALAVTISNRQVSYRRAHRSSWRYCRRVFISLKMFTLDSSVVSYVRWTGRRRRCFAWNRVQSTSTFHASWRWRSADRHWDVGVVRLCVDRTVPRRPAVYRTVSPCRWNLSPVNTNTSLVQHLHLTSIVVDGRYLDTATYTRLLLDMTLDACVYCQTHRYARKYCRQVTVQTETKINKK